MIYTLKQLQKMPTITQSKTGDLKRETPRRRVWLERVGIAEGADYDNQVIVEYLVNGRWITFSQYEAI